MRIITKKILGLAFVAGFGLSATGCDDFLDVKNPNILEAESVDPERDARLLTNSAYQQMINDWGDILIYDAWFTNEMRVGDTFPTRNEFGRRDITDTNGHISSMWSDQHENMQFARTTIRSIEAAGNTIDLARAYFTAGWSMLTLGLRYCEGTIAQDWITPRGPIPSSAMLDSAITHLEKARTVAAAVGTTDATALATAALVGIAQAHLQNGRNTEAAQAAAQVPDNFSFTFWHLDDASNRALGNDIWSMTEARASFVVGPEYRAIADAGDPRVKYLDRKRQAQDGELNLFITQKITGYGSPDRIASGLEADYIEIEANKNPAAMLAFINARRAVGGQAPISTTNVTELMRELMQQKARDFWLEGKRLPDFRRLGNTVPFIIQGGPNYYKDVQGGFVGDQTCWPVPRSEKQNNPNWPTS